MFKLKQFFNSTFIITTQYLTSNQQIHFIYSVKNVLSYKENSAMMSYIPVVPKLLKK